jgi:diguanylate cyclase (GGDEF)-like protein
LYAQDKNRAAKQQALTAASFIALPTIFAALKNALGDASFEGIPASFAFAVGCLVILYSIRRIGFLGLKAIARDRAFDVIDEGIIVSDDEWRPVDINSSARRILSNCFGLDNNANVDMIASRLSEKIKPNLASLYAGNELRFELPRSGSEHSLYFALRVFPLIDHAATVGYAGVIRDVTSDTLKMSDLRQLAERDPLTAIYNKSAFREIVSGLRALSPATGCLIIFDIDNFKDYNDRWGHLAGDSVLKDVCSYCRESLRDGDVFGRVGGDEFAVFLSNVTDDDAQALAARIKAKIAANGFTTGSNSLRVTISMGVAHSASQDESFEDLFSRADQALYRSKKEGRNRITLADRKPSPCV